MDRITFGDGVSYEKVSVIAKRFKYTADYVGQLCRARKVDARLVGRTWYVNAESLEKYQSAKNRPTEKVLIDNTNTPGSRVNVEPVIGKNTSRSLRFSSHQSVARVSSTHYNPDENDLLPRLSRSAVVPSISIPVSITDAKGIRVHTTNKITKFKASELPEVTLHGKIKVHAVSTDAVPAPASEDSAPESPVASADALPKKTTPVVASLSTVVKAQSPVQERGVDPKSIHSTSIKGEKPAPVVAYSRLQLMATPHALLLTGLATVLVVGATLFVSAEYSVSPSDASSSFSFDTSQFTALVSLISYTH